MSEREAMLERIRKALGHTPSGPDVRRGVRPIRYPELQEVMPPIPPGELLTKFEAEFEQVSGVTYGAASIHELEDVVRRILEPCHAAGVVLSRNPLLAKLGLAEKIRAWGKAVTTWPEAGRATDESQATGLRKHVAASFAAEVGITGVDFALAETGTLVLTSRTEGSQLVSLAPPVHVALYRRSQLVASLEEVLEKLPVSRDPHAPSPGRSVVFITGTSRTADIEQTLVRGVHGPREVHAILVEETCR